METNKCHICEKTDVKLNDVLDKVLGTIYICYYCAMRTKVTGWKNLRTRRPEDSGIMRKDRFKKRIIK